MAVSTATELKILVKTAGDKNLDRLSRQLDQIGKNTVQADFKFDKFSRSLQRQERQATKNISNMRAFAASWRELANSVDITSKEFRQATAEAQRLERQIAKTTGAGAKGKGAAALGAIGAAGFLGPEQLLGAGVGAMFGAPVAGAAAASIFVTPIKNAAIESANYSAELAKQRLALQLVTKDSASYQQALNFIKQTSSDLAIPQDVITRQFTKLSASVLGAGGNVRDAEKAFLGVAAGIRGTGGDLQSLDSALTATSQVFSKGKVSAEELRQQIGERLPGAFTLFAESMGMTPQELDKALEKGTVSLQDFQLFAEKLFTEYGDAAKVIADSPMAAGDRLQTALSNLSDSVGQLLAPIGAEFQSVFAEIAAAINQAAQALIRFFGLTKPQQMEKLTKDIGTTVERLTALDRRRATLAGRGDDVAGIDSTINTLRARLQKLTDEYYAMQKIENALKTDDGPKKTGLPGYEPDTKTKTAKQIKDISEEIYQLELQRNQAVKQQNELLVYQLDFGIKRQQLGEQLQAKQISQRVYNVELQKAGEKLAEGASKVESDIEKKLQKQIDFRVAAEAKIQDALFKTQNLSEEERKRIDINRTLASVREEAMKAGFEDMKELLDIINRLRDAMEGGGDGKKSFKDAFKDGIESMGNLAENLGSSLANAFGGASDALADFITTGKANFREFAQSVLQDLARIFMRYAMFQAVKGIFNLDFSANGNVMTKDGPMPLKKYANGGIAKSPQLSIFGEGSTPEAYVPLPDGRSIPVTLKGSAGGGGDVIVNVDAKGSSVEGDKKQSKLLGAAIGAAVQAELIKQKKPGGLLY